MLWNYKKIKQKFRCKEGFCIKCSKKSRCKDEKAVKYNRFVKKRRSELKEHFYCPKRKKCCSKTCKRYKNCIVDVKINYEKWYNAYKDESQDTMKKLFGREE